MYIYGKNVIKSLKDENIKIAYVYNKFQDNDILNKLKEKKIKIKYLTKDRLDNIVKANHQGIILEIDGYKYKKLEEIMKEDKIIILDHIEDPHNLGAIIRTCEAAGIKNIILPKDRSAKINGTVAKVSAGTVNNINIAQVSNLTNTINTLKKQGYWIIGTTLDGKDFKKIDYSGKIAIVIGNEGKGISKLVQKNCDFLVTIPMNGTVNSLNASVAAALIIFEAVRK